MAGPSVVPTPESKHATCTPEFEKIDAANIIDATRENRAQQLKAKTQAAVDKACEKKVVAAEEVLFAIMSARVAP